ncbi:hypothetical protein BKA70DRAFT_1218676 [Coprinopsis sp. MPI-PUGE-AT-0042]|nr:hypothetical protein BKA70DRAFT_1218676 [Coprinopsis sp. MPI-PUGE-AT-0042]
MDLELREHEGGKQRNNLNRDCFPAESGMGKSLMPGSPGCRWVGCVTVTPTVPSPITKHTGSTEKIIRRLPVRIVAVKDPPFYLLSQFGPKSGRRLKFLQVGRWVKRRPEPKSPGACISCEHFLIQEKLQSHLSLYKDEAFRKRFEGHIKVACLAAVERPVGEGASTSLAESLSTTSTGNSSTKSLELFDKLADMLLGKNDNMAEEDHEGAQKPSLHGVSTHDEAEACGFEGTKKPSRRRLEVCEPIDASGGDVDRYITPSAPTFGFATYPPKCTGRFNGSTRTRNAGLTRNRHINLDIPARQHCHRTARLKSRLNSQIPSKHLKRIESSVLQAIIARRLCSMMKAHETTISPKILDIKQSDPLSSLKWVPRSRNSWDGTPRSSNQCFLVRAGSPPYAVILHLTTIIAEALPTADAPPITEAPPIQSSGPAFVQNAQGAQNFLAPMYNPTFIQNNQQGASPEDYEAANGTPAERLRKVLDFLSLVNFRTIQQENLSKRTPDTLKWLLEGSMFQWWLETQGAIVWGTGMPGAGKTILASVVIQDSEDHAPSDVCIGYVYCRYTEPMKVRNILAALVRQLLERYRHLLPVVEPLYAKHDLEGTKPTQSELIAVIRDLCGCFRMAHLFIDGVDEALYGEQFDLLDTLKIVPANFFITSRPLVRLKDVLPNAEFFDIAAKNEDVERLVAQHIDRNPDLRQVLAADEQRERVIKKICESSHGMFLHASLMVEAVSHCTSSRSVMERLDKLPAKLDALYDETFKRIEMQPEEHAALAKRVLLWVVFAYQPLRVDDLQYAVASDPSVDWAAPDDNLPPELLLISVCCGLIAVEPHLDPGLPSDDPSNRIVRLVHYTALDALKGLFKRWEASPHSLLAEVCIERLMNCGVPSNRPKYLHRLGWYRKLPSHRKSLLDYAYESWYLHASECLQHPVEPTFEVLTFGFSQFDSLTAPIHLVAYYRLPLLLPLIDPQVNELTKEGRTPLSLAAWRNNAAMVELLLKLDGIDVSHQDEEGNTALLVAAKRGSVDVIKTLLLDPRINLHKRNKEGESALHCALGGNPGSGPAMPTWHGGSPENQLGIGTGHRATRPVAFKSFFPPTTSIPFALPLTAALANDDNDDGDDDRDIERDFIGDHVDVQRYLPPLSPFALTPPRCSSPPTSLSNERQPAFTQNIFELHPHWLSTTRLFRLCSSSTSFTATKVIPPLLKTLETHFCFHGWHGLACAGPRPGFRTMTKRDNNGQTPLMHACCWGSSSAIRWYLRLPGLDARDHLGVSALAHRAQRWGFTSYKDHVSDFRALVDAGLDVNAKDAKGFTALTYAVQGSRTSIARALLQLEGVDVNLEDGEGRTLLMVACDAVIKYPGSLFDTRSQTLDLLLQHPILDVNAKNRHGITAAAYAVAKGVIETAADLFLLASHSSNGFPARLDNRQQVLRRTGPLHDVPQLAVHMQLEEHPSNQPSAMPAHIVVTGRQSPYPPGFRLLSHSIRVMGEEDYRHRLEHLEELGFGFPWEYGRISERHARSCQ